MSCYLRHMKDILEEAGIEVTGDNKKEIDLAIHGMVEVEYKNCPVTWKTVKEHIKNDYPKMAISVYHKVDDFWKIPEQIFSIRSDYDLYIRHYTEGTDETVMFFLPKAI